MQLILASSWFVLNEKYEIKSKSLLTMAQLLTLTLAPPLLPFCP